MFIAQRVKHPSFPMTSIVLRYDGEDRALGEKAKSEREKKKTKEQRQKTREKGSERERKRSNDRKRGE